MSQSNSVRPGLLLVSVFALLSGVGTKAATLTVCESGCAYTNGQVQTALSDARPGDTILLQENYTFGGPYVFPAARGCSADDASCYITLTTGVTAAGDPLPAAAFPASDIRVTPAAAARFAKLRSEVVNEPAIRTVQPGEVGALCAGAPCIARWWRLRRIEIEPEPTYRGAAMLLLGSNNTIALSPGGDVQDRRSEVPAHFIVDQVYLHGDPVKGQLRGIAVHADDVTIKNSYIADIKSLSEGQGILALNYNGGLTVVNSHIEGNGQNFMMGGDAPRAARTSAVLDAPAPTTASAALADTTDLEPGQWVSIVVKGAKQMTIVRSVAGQDITFDPLPDLPDAPGGVNWGLVPKNLTLLKNHLYKPPSWRDPIVAAPALVAAAGADSGGTLAAGTYYYRVVAMHEVARGGQAHSPASIEAAGIVAAGSTGAVTISWGAVPNAELYYVYGRAAGGQNMRWSVAAPETTFTDVGVDGAPAAIPSVTYWQVKNNLELKATDGALIEGNVFDYSWKQAQVGYLILFTIANTSAASDSTVIRGITFQSNRLRHGSGAFQLTSQDVSTCKCQHSGRLQDVILRNNVIEDVGSAWGSTVMAIAIAGPGTIAQPRLGPKTLIIDHNTMITSGTNRFLGITLGKDSVDYKVEDFTFTNNMQRRSTYGLRYDKSPGGMQAEGLTSWTLGASGASAFTKNVVAGANCSIYPDATNNYCPSDAGWQLEFEDFAAGNLRLLSTSAYHNAGTDGKDLGADIAAADALTSVALSGDNRTVAPGSPPAIQTASLPDGRVGAGYSTALQASGGAAPYFWSVSAGTLAPGLTLSPGGVLSGIPAQGGTFVWTATVVDADGASDAREFTLAIADPVTIQTAALPNGRVWTPYSEALVATGGLTPYAWTASGLPSGFTLSAAGMLSGTTITSGTFTFTATVADSRGGTDARQVALVIAAGGAWHVAPTGDDTAAGTVDAPLATPARALELAAAGDTIYLRQGAYSIARSLMVNQPGVTLASYPGERATIAGPTTDLIDLTSMVIVYTGYVTIRDLDLEGASFYGIKLDERDGPQRGTRIARCRIRNTGRDGIKTQYVDDLVIEDNDVGPTGVRDASNAEGIDVMGSLGATIRRNYVHDSATTGIYVKAGTTNAVVEANWVQNAGEAGILLGSETAAEFMRNGVLQEAIDSVARNNVIVRPRLAGLGSSAGLNVRFENNTVIDAASAGQAAFRVVPNGYGTPAHGVAFKNNIVVLDPVSARPMVQLYNYSDPIDSNSNIWYSASGRYNFWREFTTGGTSSYWNSLDGWQQGTGADLNSRPVDPALNASDLYRPFLDSPALDAGEPVAVAFDYSGQPRPLGPAYDIGAHEGASATPPPVQPPAAPRGLAATAVSRSAIALSWTEASADEQGFRIEQSTDGVSFVEIATVGSGVVAFTSTGLKSNRTYWYRVRAFNEAGTSPYSGVASAKTFKR